MPEEYVTITADGGEITNFESVEVTAAWNEAARSFSVTVSSEQGVAQTAAKFVAGTKVTITSNGDLLLTGYVDRYQPQLKRGEALIHVSGRGKGQDFVDSSAEYPEGGGRFENKTLLEIAQALDQFGVGVHSEAQMTPIPEYQITPGESVFRLLERLARSQAMTLTGQPDGSILIAGASSGSNAALIEGGNAEEIKVDHNWGGRHSTITVLGQGTGPDGTALTIKEDAEDAAVTRDRPLTLVQDDVTDTKRAKIRAQHRRDREAARSLRAEITVQGFHDSATGGALWAPGAVVWCESPFGALAQNMVIERVVFHQARKKGTTTVITLVDPQAYGGEPSKSNESDSSWSIQEDPADAAPGR